MAASEHSTVTDPLTPESDDGPAPQPRLPASPSSGQTPAARAALAALRCFSQGFPGAGGELAPPDEGFIPALLAPFRDPTKVRQDYPLFLPAAAEDDQLCRSVDAVLRDAADERWPDQDEGRMVKDNLVRLERHVRRVMSTRPMPAVAAEVAAEAAAAMQKELSLRGDGATRLDDELKQLVESVPDGQLIELDDRAALWLLLAAARHRARGRRAALRTQAEEVLGRLRERMRLERTKTGEGEGSAALGREADVAGVGAIDPDALARVIGTPRGAPAMDAARRERVEGTMGILERFLERPDPPLVTVVAHGAAPRAWPADHAEWQAVDRGNVCRVAATVFDERSTTLAGVLAALRIGRLDLEDRYEPDRHDALLSSFDWESYTADELGLLPLVVAVESADDLAGHGLRDASRLLRSGRPVQVIVSVSPASNPGSSDDPLGGSRFELGFFGLSHREAGVQQSSSARPTHLVDGYLRSIDSACSSLHVITSGLTGSGDTPPLGAWMHAGAALEGRAHPFFHYDPSAGVTWARRFEISDNPAPEDDWSGDELACLDADGGEATLPLVFTFADYVLLDGGREHFRVMPPGVDAGSLRPLHEHLDLDDDATRSTVPFVWAADEQGHLHRLAVSSQLTLACRDRLGYWRMLQELAGVRNEHVREAVARERQRLTEEFDEQREQLERDHAVEIERVRAEALEQSLGALARGLLNADPQTLGVGLLAGPAVTPAGAPATPATPAADEAEPEVAATEGEQAVEEEEEEVAAEPWIDTPLCTTCNDCIELNRQMFVYNANKQAVIADPKAGTYRQLVEAAEKCPARCIHPGLPLDPNEPELEELIKRAKPFL